MTAFPTAYTEGEGQGPQPLEWLLFLAHQMERALAAAAAERAPPPAMWEGAEERGGSGAAGACLCLVFWGGTHACIYTHTYIRHHHHIPTTTINKYTQPPPSPSSGLPAGSPSSAEPLNARWAPRAAPLVRTLCVHAYMHPRVWLIVTDTTPPADRLIQPHTYHPIARSIDSTQQPPPCAPNQPIQKKHSAGLPPPVAAVPGLRAPPPLLRAGQEGKGTGTGI